MSSYQPNIPTGSVNLDVDYQALRANFQSLDATYQIDHVALTNTSPLKGFHKVTHLVESLADPAAVVGSGILYNKNVNDSISTDFTLYYQTSLGNIIQLTRNFVPLASANGYTFLPGGLMLQWGVKTTPPAIPAGDNAILFATANKNFTTNCFNVFLSLERSSANVDMIVIKPGTISTTGFTAIVPTSGSSAFYWVAIGN